MEYQVGDVFLRLPVGKVWRQSLEIVPPKKHGGWAARWVMRTYWLDRGVARNAKTGEERQLFSTFTVLCLHEWCGAHAAQLDAIMRSIRLGS